VDLERLFKKAEWETLTPSELEEVARAIASPNPGDLYQLLHILGRAGSPAYKAQVEKFLHCPDDPQRSALVLKILCRWWGLFDQYRNDVMAFLRGVDWDDWGYVRLQALSLAGEHLREHQDNEMLRIVYQTYADRSHRPLLRSAAYSALCRSEGLAWADLPSAAQVIDLSKEVDPSVISRIEEKLRSG